MLSGGTRGIDAGAERQSGTQSALKAQRQADARITRRRMGACRKVTAARRAVQAACRPHRHNTEDKYEL